MVEDVISFIYFLKDGIFDGLVDVIYSVVAVAPPFLQAFLSINIVLILLMGILRLITG